ncbi:uncharacterized protein [Palaemon carinicauda]|uniref:uncharacterized protein n=1 Tax=Palaemon carinicauda TaxID=392227 RepID=UPI0035B5E9B6
MVPLCQSTAKLLKTKFILHGIARDAKYIDTDSAASIFPQPERCFAHIHVDVVRLLPTSQGYRYLLPAIDRFTCWSEAISMEMQHLPHVHLHGWVARFGIPKHITSDRGTTFTSQLWTLFVNLLGITLHQTTAYNPAVNEMVECFHRTLKAALMSHCNDYNWLNQLPSVLLGLRATPKDALNDLAAKILYGDTLGALTKYFPSTTSSDNIQRLRHVVDKITLCQQTYKPPEKQRIPTDLRPAMHVYLSNDTSKPPVTTPYMGPFLKIQCTTKAFLINIRGQ